MPESAIAVGDKLHVITRRRFESEERHHFVGEVTAVSDELCRVRGYAFVFDPGTHAYTRCPEVRTRLFSLGQEGFIVNAIPRTLDIASLEYRTVEERLVVTDGGKFSLDINEFAGSP
jgi:hypothetical protein